MTDPWTNGPYRVSTANLTNSGQRPVMAGDVRVALVDIPYGGTADDREANARLFAAAPDLVAVLDDLMAEQNGPPLCDPRHEKAWQRAMDNAAAVLARVRGDTQEQP